MANVKISPKLEENLRKLKVLTKFRKNVDKTYSIRGGKYVVLTLECAFVWDISIEGFEFWMDINKKIINLNEGGKQ